MRRICLACDLKDDPTLIEKYRGYHAPGQCSPEIAKSIFGAGVLSMEIYLVGNRMFMIMEVTDDFDPDRKRKMDEENPAVQAWEELMWKFQQELPWANPGEKWMEMEQIFSLKK